MLLLISSMVKTIVREKRSLRESILHTDNHVTGQVEMIRAIHSKV